MLIYDYLIKKIGPLDIQIYDRIYILNILKWYMPFKINFDRPYTQYEKLEFSLFEIL